MKKIKMFKGFFYSVLFAGLLFTACTNNSEMEDVQALKNLPSVANFTSQPIPGQYIVVLNNNYANKLIPEKGLSYDKKISKIKDEISSDLSKIGLSKEDILNTYAYAVKGFSARLTPAQVSALKNDDRIKYIEEDQMLTLSPIKAFRGGRPSTAGPGNTDPVDPVQEMPWGITRVGGGSYSGTATAWIIDTGIDMDHPDLNVDTGRSACFLDAGGEPDDENGHGTHVSGTVAAIDNTIGVVGVAPGATLVAVRVLDRNGSGTTSGVIAGVDYVAANGQPGDVANMSLGGDVSETLDDAVINAAATGVRFALAAGNESDDANNHSPARANHENIYTVSAMDINDYFAYFSNYGNPPIEFCAPGVDIYSTWMGGGYNTISGTSMASPHVCGLLLLGTVNSDGYVNGDPDGDPDPIAHN